MTEERRLAHVERIPIRWGDMDAMGHVNNTVYFRYMEQARISWFEQLIPEDEVWRSTGIVIVNATCSHICTLKLSGKLQIAARGAKVRTQKITSLVVRLAGGRKTQLKVKLGKAKRALLKALAARGKAKLLLKASATAPATTPASAKLTVKLKQR